MDTDNQPEDFQRMEGIGDGGRHRRQVRGLTEEDLTAIEATALERRRLGGRGDRFESAAAAKERGLLDVALIRVMRDGMLRPSESSALTWENLTLEPDGTAKLHIVHSKTDQTGKGDCCYLGKRAVQALEAIRPDNPNPGQSIFGLSGRQIGRRIRAAALQAGLGDRFGGGSPRNGMSHDLVRSGIPVPAIMQAGRWRSPTLGCHSVKMTVNDGAIAEFYANLDQAE